MADDPRTYIRVHDGMPDHPKIEPLSDKAFRVIVSTWCWSSRQRTDGRVKRAVWNKRATPAVRRELAGAGLVEEDGPDHVRLHDYLDWNRSKAEIDERTSDQRAAKQKASQLGNHRRWHTGPTGSPSEDCTHCQTASHVGSLRDPIRDRNGIAEGSIRGIGIGIGRESGSVGGGVPDTNASDFKIAPTPIYDPENPRCAAHAHIPPGQPVPNCRACADVRRQTITAAEIVAAEDAETSRSKRAAIDACPDCDESGYPNDHTSGPLVRCTHPKLVEEGQP